MSDENLEFWLDSKTLYGTHMVSSNGRVKRIEHRINSSFGATRVIRERISTYSPSNKNGYKRLNLIRDGKLKGFLVHRLVAEIFCENPYNYPHVNHIDGDKLNNEPSNLEWCTHKQNMEHAARIGLTNCRVSVCSNKSGAGYWYPSLEDAMIHTKISKPCICSAAKKKQKIAGGMIWDYAKS